MSSRRGREGAKRGWCDLEARSFGLAVVSAAPLFALTFVLRLYNASLLQRLFRFGRLDIGNGTFNVRNARLEINNFLH
jgi:hypothetical protein